MLVWAYLSVDVAACSALTTRGAAGALPKKGAAWTELAAARAVMSKVESILMCRGLSWGWL